jgi:serine phosphatase RsbU (regulator of sigma subunit)/putative methionine-R-sulfoxide reductase with GAF domain
VSVALGRARSRQALAVTARRLNALQRCTSQLAGLLRTDDIADAMVAEARTALQSRNAALYVVDGDAARLVAIAGASDIELGGAMALRETTALAEALRTEDLAVDSANEGSGVATIVAPIMGRQGVAAALQLWFDDGRDVDEGECLLLRSLATLISSAWRRAELFEEEERERAGSAHRAERAGRLATLVATLADARDRTAVAAAVAAHGLSAVDAAFGGIFELDPARRVLRLVSGRTAGKTWTPGMTIRLDRPMALTTAAREARVVTMATHAEIVAQHPDEEVHPRQQARAAVPLVSFGQVIGALGFAWDEPHVFDEGEITYLQTVATRVAEALERGRLYEGEREDERRWNLLAQASARLADATEPHAVLSALVRWAVPLLADSCTVYLAQPDGTARPFVSVDLADHPDAEEIFERERIDLASDHPISRLYRLRRTLLLEDLESDTVNAAVGDDAARVDRVRALAVRHAIAAPLSARNQQLGLLVLTMGRSGRSFTANDVELVSDLASRFSIVYDNAVLFATERNIGARLQAALLPASLEPPPMLDVAVRYEASGSRAGGDWYDLISFGDHGAALVVGDLVGHGVEAAATMSRYRSALRAHGRMFEEPADVMNAFSTFIHTDEAGQTATVLYSRIRPASSPSPGSSERATSSRTATLTYCSAGHPPPILLHEHRAITLPSPQGPLIGLVRGGYIAHTVDLPAGAIVLLYTDGLLERRGETLDDGLRRLVDVVAALPSDDLDRFVDDLLTTMADDVHDDDIAVIAARLGAPAENPA